MLMNKTTPREREQYNGDSFYKVVRIGTVNIGGDKPANLFVKISYNNGRLSISGVEEPLRNGDALGSCGQIDMHEWDIVKLAPSWTREMIEQLRLYWKLYHLNDMQSACEHQRDMGWEYEDHHDKKTFKGEACPVCGYEIGSAWLRKDVPADVLRWLKSLPDSDKTPAWI